MKSRFLSLCTLLYLLSTSGMICATELPTTVQFDIIFPRNNSVYKPVYPFPVVFGLHNGSAAWSYQIHWGWSIYEISETGSDPNLVASGRWRPGVPTIEQLAPPPDSYFIIDPVNELINTTHRYFHMIYKFGITQSCNETTREVPLERELDVTFNDYIRFRLDPQGGEVPNLADIGPCATPVGSVGIRTDVELFGDGGRPCPVLDAGPQPTQSCAMPLNNTLATKVAARMLQHANCSEQTTWPNATGLLGKCRPKRSGQGRLGGDAIMFSSVTVFAAFVVLLYL
ncbi:hypothetical protein E8E13_008611 [Curvularia kusanoi]|uniref:DUF7136 domain-containing protein n=1 Tax=Curvularia kusanoi TaxID=90978 RepID=A0A9P4TEA9_CURKU|nr:hypothetical protein E8E13_008611 [Curvularia kusanoi]